MDAGKYLLHSGPKSRSAGLQLLLFIAAAFVCGASIGLLVQNPRRWYELSVQELLQVAVSSTCQLAGNGTFDATSLGDRDGEDEPLDAPLPGTYRWYQPYDDWALPAVRWRQKLSRALHQDPTLRMRGHKSLMDVTYAPEVEAEFMTMAFENQFPPSCEGRVLLVLDEPLYGLAWGINQQINTLQMAMSLNWTLVPAMGGRPFSGCADNNMGCYFNITSCLPNLATGKSRRADIEAALQTKLIDACVDTIANTTARDEVMRGRRAFNFGSGGGRCPATAEWQRRLVSRWAHKGWFSRASGESVASDRCFSDPEITFLFDSLAARFLMTPSKAVRDRGRDIVEQFAWKPPVAAVKIRRADKASEDPNEGCQHYRPISAYLGAAEMQATLQGYSWKSLILMTDSRIAQKEFLEAANRSVLLQYPDGNKIVPTAVIHNRPERNTMFRWVSKSRKDEVDFSWHEMDATSMYESNVDYAAEMWLMGEVSEYAIGMTSSNGGRLVWMLMGANRRVLQTLSVGPVWSGVDGAWFTGYYCCP